MFSLITRLILTMTVLWSGAESTSFVNVALKKPTRQNDNFWERGPDLAVDGNTNMNFYKRSCSHTYSRNRTWWVVDLLANYPIHSVKIYSRTNDPHLRDFYVYVAKNNPLVTPIPDALVKPGELCFKYEGLFPNKGVPTEIPCNSSNNKPITGRYLYFWKPGHEKLCLCEVQVLVEEQFAYSNIYSQLESSSVGLYVKKGFKSALTSFSSKVISRPFRSLMMQCVLHCFTVTYDNGVRVTTVQVAIASDSCECLEKSTFDNNLADVVDKNWILMELTTN